VLPADRPGGARWCEAFDDAPHPDAGMLAAGNS